MGFWQNVDDECEYQGISRKELANAVHFSVNTISSGIKRNGMPEADLAVRISKVLNVPIERLLGSDCSVAPVEKTDFREQQKLFSIYYSYVQKLEKMPKSVRNAIFTLIDNAVP